MSKPVLKTRDVVVIRQYTYRGISVLVRIDRAKKKIDIVEPGGPSGYQPKKWVFVDRTEDYVRTWVVIMDAMKHATEAALKELEFLKDAEFESLVSGMLAMSKAAKPTPRKK